MCIAITVDKKATRPTKDTLSTCFTKNSHGAGFAWAPGDGKVHVHKGLMTFQEFWDAYSTEVPADVPHLIHFRLATSGLKAESGYGWHPGCTHPFPVTTHVDSLYMTEYSFAGDVMVHNGIFTGLGDDLLSDTQEAVIDVAGGKDTWERLATSSRVATIDPSGKITRWASWVQETTGDGVWYSNGGYKSYNSGYTYTGSSYSTKKYGPSAPTGAALPKALQGLKETTHLDNRSNFTSAGLTVLDHSDLVVLPGDEVVSVQDLLFIYGSPTYTQAEVAVNADDTVYLCFSYKKPVPIGTLVDIMTKKGGKLFDKYWDDVESCGDACRSKGKKGKKGKKGAATEKSVGTQEVLKLSRDPKKGDTCRLVHGEQSTLGTVVSYDPGLHGLLTVRFEDKDGHHAGTFSYPAASWHNFVVLTNPPAPAEEFPDGTEVVFIWGPNLGKRGTIKPDPQGSVSRKVVSYLDGSGSFLCGVAHLGDYVQKVSRGKDVYLVGDEVDILDVDRIWHGGYVVVAPDSKDKYRYLVKNKDRGEPFNVDRVLMRHTEASLTPPKVGDRYEILSGFWEGKVGEVYRTSPHAPHQLYLSVEEPTGAFPSQGARVIFNLKTDKQSVRKL